MHPERMLENSEVSDTIIGDALALVERLSVLHPDELLEHLEEMNTMIALLETERGDSVARREYATLSRLREAALKSI